MKLEGCSLYFDGTVVTSPTCWDGANVFGPVGKTLVKSKYPAQQIQVINMTVNAIDENPVPGSDVAAAGGKFQVKYTHVQCVLSFCFRFSWRREWGVAKEVNQLSHLGGKKTKQKNFYRFAENTQFALFNKLNQAIVTDPRLTEWVPDVGEFGASGTLRGKNVTTGRPVIDGYTKKPGQLIPLGTGSKNVG